MKMEQAGARPPPMTMTQAGIQDPTAITATGLGKATATGARGGLEGIVSAPGDLVTWETRKAAELAKYLGASPETVQSIQNYGQTPTRGPGMATTADVQGATDTAVKALLPQGAAATVQDVTRHQPQNTAEELAQTAGSFLPAAIMPGSAAARLARVAIPTAAVETAGRATRALAPEYEDAARIVAGMVAGGRQAAAEGGFRLRSNLRKIGAAGPQGIERVKQLLIEQGMSPEDAVARTKELGPQGMLLDTGPNVRQEAQQIQAAGGAGRGIIDPALRGRDVGRNQRLTSDVTQAVGPEVQRTDVLAALADRKAALGPEYEAAHAGQTKPAELQPIADAIDSELAVVKSPEVTAALERIKKSLHLRGTDQLDPSSEGLHEARQAIDNELYDSQGRPRDVGSKTAATLNRYRKMIDDTLANVGPIKGVDVKRSQIGKEEQAFTTGQQVYDNPRGSPSAVEFKRTWDTMSPGEQSRGLEGVNQETWRQLNISGNDLVKLQGLLKGEGKANFEKLATVIGDQKASQLMDAVGREKTFQESSNKIVQGSKTAESGRQPARGFRQAVSEAIPEVIASGATLGPSAGVSVGLAHLRRFITERAGKTGQPKLDAEVARLLTSDKPEDLLQALKVIEQHQSHSPTGAMLGALLARKQGGQ